MGASVTLGRNVAKLRQLRGLSQTQLAAQLGPNKLGISQGYLSELEAGDKNPTLSTIEAIAQALKVSISELLVEQQEDGLSYKERRRLQGYLE